MLCPGGNIGSLGELKGQSRSRYLEIFVIEAVERRSVLVGDDGRVRGEHSRRVRYSRVERFERSFKVTEHVIANTNVATNDRAISNWRHGRSLKLEDEFGASRRERNVEDLIGRCSFFPFFAAGSVEWTRES